MFSKLFICTVENAKSVLCFVLLASWIMYFLTYSLSFCVLAETVVIAVKKPVNTHVAFLFLPLLKCLHYRDTCT